MIGTSNITCETSSNYYDDEESHNRVGHGRSFKLLPHCLRSTNTKDTDSVCSFVRFPLIAFVSRWKFNSLSPFLHFLELICFVHLMENDHRKAGGGVAGMTALEWAEVQNCFDKLVHFLRSTQDRDGKCAISVEDYMNAYTRIFNMHVKSNTAETALRPRRVAARSVQLSSREETTLTTLMELFRTWLRDVLRLYAEKSADVPMLEHFGVLWGDFSIIMRVTGKVLKPIVRFFFPSSALFDDSRCLFSIDQTEIEGYIRI